VPVRTPHRTQAPGWPLARLRCLVTSGSPGEKDLSPHIAYFAERTNIPYFCQVNLGQRDYELAQSRARVLPMTAQTGSGGS